MSSYINANTISLNLPSQFHPFPKSQTQISFPFNSIFKFTHKPTSIISYLNKPTSNSSLSSPKNPVPDFLSKKIATLLVGSVIFMGVFSKKPVLAQPTYGTTQTQTLEETETDEKEMMYAKLLEDNPNNIEALKSIFHLKMKSGKTKEAIDYVERLIGVEPKEVEWRLLQALCYELIGEYSKAKNFFKKILKEKPLLLRALHGLAMLMHKNHEGPAVFDMLNKALEIARRQKKVTEERSIRILIAQMHVVKREFDDALKLFKELIDENPRDFRPYLCQGIVYSLVDKKEEAEEQFSTYKSLLPNEFPEGRFLDDVVLAAKTELRQKRKKPDFLYKK